MPRSPAIRRPPGTLFRCPRCGARYPHRMGYAHAVFHCPLRIIFRRLKVKV